MKDALTNPEELASSERVRTYLRGSREAVLAELQASEREIERGLDLHRNTIVCDLCGGGRGHGYTPEMDDLVRRRLNETADDDLTDAPPVVYATHSVPAKFYRASQIMAEADALRPLAMARNADLRADNYALLQAAGKTLFTTGSGGVEGLASFNYFFDEVDFVHRVVRMDQVEKLKARGEWGILYHLHSAGPLRPESKSALDDLEEYYRLGVRWSMLFDNELGGRQWHPERGLSDQGREAMRRMNELGIIVDPSHCPQQTTLEMVETSEKPVIVSHVGCKAVHPGYCRDRNITDESMKAVADKGGLVGICSIFTLLGENSIEMFMRHVDHAAQLIGTDHIGFASDAGPGFALELPETIEAITPDQWNTANPWDLTLETQSQHAHMANSNEANWKIYTEPHALSECCWPYNVTVALVQRGYSDDDIQKMIGGNFMRVAPGILGH